MYKVTKDYKDGLTGELNKAGDIIEVKPERVEALGDFIKPMKKEITMETEMIGRGEYSEKAILEKPKNKGKTA